MTVYHLEHYVYDETLCGIEFEEGDFGDLSVLYRNGENWELNKNGALRENNIVTGIENKEFCVTCLLVYADDPSILL